MIAHDWTHAADEKRNTLRSLNRAIFLWSLLLSVYANDAAESRKGALERRWNWHHAVGS